MGKAQSYLEEEPGVLVFDGLKVDVPTHALDDGFGDHQTEAGAFDVRGGVVRGL